MQYNTSASLKSIQRCKYYTVLAGFSRFYRRFKKTLSAIIFGAACAILIIILLWSAVKVKINISSMQQCTNILMHQCSDGPNLKNTVSYLTCMSKLSRKKDTSVALAIANQLHLSTIKKALLCASYFVDKLGQVFLPLRITITILNSIRMIMNNQITNNDC